MPKKNLEPVVEPKVELKAEAPNARVDNTRVEVFDAVGNFVREYNLKLHGEKMVDYAKEYSKKIKGSWRYPILL